MERNKTDTIWAPLKRRESVALIAMTSILSAFISVVLMIFFQPSKIGVTDIIVSGLGTLGVGMTAYFGYLGVVRQHSQVERAEKEIRFQRGALDFSAFIHEWGEVMTDIENLMNETNIDRFFILRAWNGYLDPKWTTAVFQVHQGKRDIVSYTHYELDRDYVSKIRDIIDGGRILFNTEDLPDTADLKAVYQNEGVISAAWYHLDSEIDNGSMSKAVSYCSFASRSGEICQNTYTRCSILAARLRGAASDFK